MPPRTVIIGAGFAARVVHLPGFTASGHHVAAICDVNEEPAKRLAAQHNIPKVYANWREMIDKEKPDAVSVCLPNSLHKEPVLYAFEKGAHVLCEKPLAISVTDANEMFEAARRANRVLMAAQMWRFDARSRAVKRCIDAGDLGEIYYGEATALRRMGIPTWGVFHQAKFSHGGALLDIGVHMLDLAIWLMGNPTPVRVSATAAAKFGKRPEIAKMLRNAWDPTTFDVEDFAVALVHFNDGKSLLLRTSWAAHIEQETFSVRVLGTEAGCTTIPPVVYRNHEGMLIDQKITVGEAPAQNRQMSHWLRVIEGKEEPLVRPVETLNVQKIIDAAYRSAAEGAEVAIGE
jgi:predicted dehydrogenase